MARITDEHRNHYLEHGYVVVEGFLTAEDLADARRAIEERIPGFFAYAADPGNTPEPKPVEGAFDGLPVAPLGNEPLDRVVFDPEIQAFVAQHIGHDDLLMEGGILQLKTSGDTDQDLHWDFGNHTLAYPSSDPTYEQIPCIAYYTDVTVDTAPTYVVSRRHYSDEICWPSWKSREDRPDLYEHEQPVEAPAGSLLMYSVRTYHRGSAFRGPGARAVQFFTYCSSRYPWLGITGHAGRAATPQMIDFLQRATVEARNAIGFPPPGHPYWTEETIDGVSARYPEMDMTPYTTSRASVSTR